MLILKRVEIWGKQMNRITEMIIDAGPAVIIGQALGIIGMILAMISFQCKNIKVFCALQTFSGLSFTVHFFVLGNAVQGALNMFNILRGWAFGFAPESWRRPLVGIVMACYIGAAVVTYSPRDALWVTALILIAQLANTVTMYIGNAKIIRLVQIGYISPAWMTSNIITFSIGGILCETFNIISSTVALIRFRKEWFPKKERPTALAEG